MHMTNQYFYNIHDVITVASEGELPELEPFITTERIAQPTIDVRIGKPTRKNHDAGARHLFYTELLHTAGFEAEIEINDRVHVVASPLLRLSPHVLYTNLIEPILRWTFVQKGYALVHGATIAFGDKAYMITARTDTGKTTTLLKILDHQRRDTDKAAFISDDQRTHRPRHQCDHAEPQSTLFAAVPEPHTLPRGPALRLPAQPGWTAADGDD